MSFRSFKSSLKPSARSHPQAEKHLTWVDLWISWMYFTVNCLKDHSVVCVVQTKSFFLLKGSNRYQVFLLSLKQCHWYAAKPSWQIHSCPDPFNTSYFYMLTFLKDLIRREISDVFNRTSFKRLLTPGFRLWCHCCIFLNLAKSCHSPNSIWSDLLAPFGPLILVLILTSDQSPLLPNSQHKTSLSCSSQMLLFYPFRTH